MTNTTLMILLIINLQFTQIPSSSSVYCIDYNIMLDRIYNDVTVDKQRTISIIVNYDLLCKKGPIQGKLFFRRTKI